MGVADRFLLVPDNRRRLSADVTRAILSVERTGSMESKPGVSVTVDDPRDRLMQSATLLRPETRALGTPAPSWALNVVDVELDGIVYRLAKAARSGDQVTLTFDHRGAVLLEAEDSPMSAGRSSTTRAEFIRRQVLAVGRKHGTGEALAFWSPQVDRRMPVAAIDRSQLAGGAESDRDVHRTTLRVKSAAGLVVKGKRLTTTQRRNAATLIERARRHGAPLKATLALLEAGIVEPSAPPWGPFDNPTGGDASSVGILQLLSMHLHGSTSTDGGRRDVALVSDLFLLRGFTGRGGAIALARSHPGASPGQIAQLVQGSAFPDRYEHYRRDAERVLAALGGDAKVLSALTAGESVSETYVKPYRFRRPRGKGGWTSTGELADEVGRRRFVTTPARGVDLFVYSDDLSLLALPAQATIDGDSLRIVGRPEYDLDRGKTIRTARLEVLGSDFDPDFAWGLPVTVKDAGALSGKWLVWSVTENDGAPTVDVELRQPTEDKPEPAPEIGTLTRADSSDASIALSIGEGGNAIDRVYARAVAISGSNYPYVWGGGHGTAGRPDRGTGRDPGIGYDCSGYTAACLLAGGMLPAGWVRGVPASGTFASSWGRPGRGKWLTVWANSVHVFIEFSIKGRRGRYADTSRQAGGGSGPHIRYGTRSAAGFTPRHWPGT